MTNKISGIDSLNITTPEGGMSWNIGVHIHNQLTIIVKDGDVLLAEIKPLKQDENQTN